MKRFKVKAFLATSAVLGSVFSQGAATNAFWGENAVRNVAQKLFGIKKDNWKGREEEIREFVESEDLFEGEFYKMREGWSEHYLSNALERLAEEAVEQRDKATEELRDVCRKEEDLLFQKIKEIDEVREKIDNLCEDKSYWDQLGYKYRLEYNLGNIAYNKPLEVLNAQDKIEALDQLEALKRKDELNCELKRLVSERDQASKALAAKRNSEEFLKKEEKVSRLIKRVDMLAKDLNRIWHGKWKITF